MFRAEAQPLRHVRRLDGVLAEKRHLGAADPEPARDHLLAPDGRARAGQQLPGARRRAGPFALEDVDELPDLAVVLRAVDAAQVGVHPAGEEGRKVRIGEKDRDELLRAGHRPGEQGGVLLQHPGPGQRGRRDGEDAVAAVQNPPFELVDEHVPRRDLPGVEEDRQPGLVEILGEPVDLLGVHVGIGEEHVERRGGTGGLGHAGYFRIKCRWGGGGEASPPPTFSGGRRRGCGRSAPCRCRRCGW